MPWNRHDYPPTWEQVRAEVLARAQHCCEGSPAYPECRARNGEPHPVTSSRVVLTTAHLCRCVPKCGHVEHCRSLCQRCHLTLDSALHVQHAAVTRRHAQEAAGQLPLAFMR
jgi:hypothetical protein